MKSSDSFPSGPVFTAVGTLFMLTAAMLPSAFSWLGMILGLCGIVLFFVGFRFLAGPSNILCPQCQKKVSIRNRLLRELPSTGSLRCPHCGTILRTDSRTIV